MMRRWIWTFVGVLALGCGSDDKTQTHPTDTDGSDGADSNADGSDSTDATDGAEGPLASIEPEIVYFAHVGANESDSREVRVENVGSAELVLNGFRLTGHPAFRFVYAEGGSEVPKSAAPAAADVYFTAPFGVLPGKSALFQVSFSPESGLLSTGSLTLYTNEAVAEHQIDLVANNALPCLTISPAKVEFGARLVGHKAVLPVEIRSCGGEAVQVTAILLASNETGTFGLDFAPLPSHLAPSSAKPLAIEPGQTATFNVEYTPSQNGSQPPGEPDFDFAQIRVLSNAFESAVELEASGFGSDVICPTAVGKIEEGEQVLPKTTLHFSDTGSGGAFGPVVKRQWSVKQPPGSQSVFIPSGTFPNPTFEANVAGTYEFALNVWDDTNTKSCVPWQGVVLVVADHAIHVELVWHTPGDSDETNEGAEAGSDLNLHFVHTKYAVGSGFDGDKDGVDDPWFHQPYDCFWFNANPNWGTFDPTANDDPHLDTDDTDGVGPENIRLANPQNSVEYRVGVHYWSDHEFGPSLATVRIYVYDELAAEFPEVELSHLDMWCVATIQWPSGDVAPCPDAEGEPDITPNYQNPYFIPN